MTDDTPKTDPEVPDTSPSRIIFGITVLEQADGNLQFKLPPDAERYAASLLIEAAMALTQALSDRRHAAEHPIIGLPGPKRIRLN